MLDQKPDSKESNQNLIPELEQELFQAQRTSHLLTSREKIRNLKVQKRLRKLLRILASISIKMLFLLVELESQLLSLMQD